MKYILQLGRILLFCLAGELLHFCLPLPIPASIYGLALLLIALKTKLVRLDQVRETGRFLTGLFALLFIPGAVGVIERLDEIRQLLLPFLAALLPMTILVFAATGLATGWALDHFKKAKENSSQKKEEKP